MPAGGEPATLGLAVTVGLLIGLVVLDAPPLLRLIVFVPAAMARIGLPPGEAEVLRRVRAAGRLQLRAPGSTARVEDEAARAADRRRANQIGLASGLIGLVVALVAVLLPI